MKGRENVFMVPIFETRVSVCLCDAVTREGNVFTLCAPCLPVRCVPHVILDVKLMSYIAGL